MKYRCRCNRCRMRKNLNKHPDDYVRVSYIKCGCGGQFVLDRYRQSGRERKKNKPKVCHCSNWPFPHRETHECPDGRIFPEWEAMYE